MSGLTHAYALSGSNLVSFNTATPTVGTTISIAGVTAGETLVGIDFRPQNGLLYGFGVNSFANTGTLYAISIRTGQAAAVGAAGQIAFIDGVGNTVDLPSGNNYGFDFNPTTDRVRVTTTTGLNFRINPNTGAPIDGDNDSSGSVPGINPDGAITGGGISGAAHTNNKPFAGFTRLYTLDSTGDQLEFQDPPNSGTQTLVAPLGVTFTGVNGFDIGASDSAFALLTVGVSATTGLYSINLATGAATLVGNFLTGTTPANGLAIQNDLGGIPAIALSADGLSIASFNTASPGGGVVLVTISGLTAGETLVGIDFRPATGQLYAFGVNAAFDFGSATASTRKLAR
jgi:hypothetical protein